MFFSIAVLIAAVSACLIDYENPGPHYSSALEDAKLVFKLPAIAVGICDSQTRARLKYLYKGGSPDTKAIHQRRVERQKEIAGILLTHLQSCPPPSKEKTAAVLEAIEKSGFLADVRSVLKPRHAPSTKDDKQLAETMGRKTSVDFVTSYASSQSAYYKALMKAEIRAIGLLRDTEFLKKAGVEKDASIYSRLATSLELKAKSLQSAVMENPNEIFVRNGAQEVSGRSGWEYLGGVVQSDFLEPIGLEIEAIPEKVVEYAGKAGEKMDKYGRQIMERGRAAAGEAAGEVGGFLEPISRNCADGGQDSDGV